MDVSDAVAVTRGQRLRRASISGCVAAIFSLLFGLSACPAAQDASGCLCEGACPGGAVHTADTGGDYRVSLSELLRVIQFFSSSGYGCAEGDTEDGYAPGAGDTGCSPHASDYAPQDWQINLSELLRVIQFFNSSGYHACPEEATEDGFCPGLSFALPEPPKRPIIIGVEYGLPGLGPSFTGMGLGAVKPLPERFSWDIMQAGPEAPLDFTRLDGLVAEFQCAGNHTITLGLVHRNSWASIDPGSLLVPGTNYAPKPEYHGLYQAWVGGIVERFDFDGVDDMPGLLGPINHIEIGVEFSSYEPGPVADYLSTLELAYAAAHAASDTVRVHHVAFFIPMVFDEDPAPEDVEDAFVHIPDRIQTPAFEDFQAIFDRPDIFDAMNIHFLSWPYEVEPALRWMHYEMERRGYTKPIIVADTIPSPFAGFGISTTCTGLPNLLALMVRPAVEADRCRLADYFQLLVNEDPDTLAWAHAHTGIDNVKKTVMAASMGVELINTSFMQDMIFNQPGASAGNAGWGGMVDSHADLIRQVQVVTRLRPAYYALKQLGEHFVGYDTVERVAVDAPDVYVYAITDSESLQGARWIAWYEPRSLVLPGDAIPQTILPFVDAGADPVVTRVITAEDQTVPDAVVYSTDAGVPQLPLDPTPFYIVPAVSPSS